MSLHSIIWHALNEDEEDELYDRRESFGQEVPGANVTDWNFLPSVRVPTWDELIAL